jgi:large subunit ribosomal protein L15
MTVVDLSSIEGLFTANEALTPTILVEKGIVATFKGRIPVVKILANGEITKAVMITGCAISASAKEKVIKVGGSVKDLPSNVVLKVKKPQSEKAKVVAAAALKANAEAKTPKKSDAKTESKGEVKSKEKSKK